MRDILCERKWQVSWILVFGTLNQKSRQSIQYLSMYLCTQKLIEGQWGHITLPRWIWKWLCKTSLSIICTENTNYFDWVPSSFLKLFGSLPIKCTLEHIWHLIFDQMSVEKSLCILWCKWFAKNNVRLSQGKSILMLSLWYFLQIFCTGVAGWIYQSVEGKHL